MSWLSKLFFGPSGGIAPLALAEGSLTTGYVSPWAEATSAHAIVWSDIYRGGTDAVDRTSAMTVAPIKRGRDIIVSRISDLPLEAGRFRGDEFAPLDRQPAWLTSTKTVSTVWHRMSMTLDDLIFTGWSLWVL
jgi:hypothetical protein